MADSEAMLKQTVSMGECWLPTHLARFIAQSMRKAAFETIEDLDEAFLRAIADQTAGSPLDDSVKRTHLTRGEIAQLLPRQENIPVSVTVIDQLLAKHHYRRRQAQKTRATGSHPQRNEQFENIQRWRQQYQAVGNPVLSMDTPKKN